MTAQLANEFNSFGASIETPAFQNPARKKSPGSGGTITKGGETFQVKDDKSVAAIKEAKAASEKHDAEVAAALKEKAAADEKAAAAQLKVTEEANKNATAAASRQLQAQQAFGETSISAYKTMSDYTESLTKRLSALESNVWRFANKQ